MNTEYVNVLKKYGITMTKRGSGIKEMHSNSYLSTFICFWTLPENIDEFVYDIDLCLNNKYDQIEDPDWSIYTFTTEITPEGLRIYDVDDNNTITGFDIYPLQDIKYLLLAWKEFLLS